MISAALWFKRKSDVGACHGHAPRLRGVRLCSGINTAIYSPSGANSGVGFAVPVDLIRSSVSQIIQFGKVLRPILGISFAPDQSVEQVCLLCSHMKAPYGAPSACCISNILKQSQDAGGNRPLVKSCSLEGRGCACFSLG